MVAIAHIKPIVNITRGALEDIKRGRSNIGGNIDHESHPILTADDVFLKETVSQIPRAIRRSRADLE